MEIILCPLRAHRPVVEEIDALLDVSMLERDASSDGEDLFLCTEGSKQAPTGSATPAVFWLFGRGELVVSIPYNRGYALYDNCTNR